MRGLILLSLCLFQAGLLALGSQIVDLGDKMQQGDLDSLEALRQAQVRIGADLSQVQTLAADADSRARGNVTQVHLVGLVEMVEEMQEGLRKVEEAQEGVQSKMANVIDHQKLGENNLDLHLSYLTPPLKH